GDNMKPHDKLIQELHQGKLSRREFLQKAVALGAAGTVSGSLFSTQALASTPKRGGHMRVATNQGSSTDSLNPILLTSGHTNFLHYTIHNQLTEIDAYGQLQPLIAESFEIGADASEWVFKLRKDVVFHNGKTLTSDDVIASLGRHRGEESASAMKSFMEQIVGLSKDGDHIVKIKLDTASVDFPVILGASSLGILPSVNGKVEAFDVGCGSYMLEAFEPGQYSKVKRNPNHFMSDRAFVDSAEIVTIADPTARTNALLTGEVDVIADIDSTTADRLKGR
ncbi:uncharacterized protein METZ01_LOCUS407689, partial [marine metagenome]